MSKAKWLTNVTNATLDKEIKDLRGIISNVLERAQVIAVAIIEHDQKHGDCSRAKDLVNSLKSRDQRQMMMQFLAHFGAIGVTMENNVATGVGHIDSKSKRYNTPSIDGAKANNWYEAYDAQGNKADWFQGPARPAYLPGTLGDVGQNIVNFADRLNTQLDAERDNGRGTKVPVFGLTNEEKHEVQAALAIVSRIGNTLAARERLSEAQAEAERLQREVSNASNIMSLGEAELQTTTEASNDQPRLQANG